MRQVIAAIIAAGAVSAPGTAAAYDYDITEESGADYTVEFFDDDLSADTWGPIGDAIRVRPMGVRRTLLRPRTSFVAELITSVEEM